MPSWIGPWEIAIVLVLALLIFGPRKLPDLGASLGKSIRGFKKGLKETEDEVNSAVAEVRETSNVTTTEAQATPTAEATAAVAAAEVAAAPVAEAASSPTQAAEAVPSAKAAPVADAAPLAEAPVAPAVVEEAVAEATPTEGNSAEQAVAAETEKTL